MKITCSNYQLKASYEAFFDGSCGKPKDGFQIVIEGHPEDMIVFMITFEESGVCQSLVKYDRTYHTMAPATPIPPDRLQEIWKYSTHNQNQLAGSVGLRDAIRRSASVRAHTQDCLAECYRPPASALLTVLHLASSQESLLATKVCKRRAPSRFC